MPMRSATSFWVSPGGLPGRSGDHNFFPVPELLQGLPEELLVYHILQGPGDEVAVCAQDVGEEQLVAVPVGVDGLIQGDLRLWLAIFRICIRISFSMQREA